MADRLSKEGRRRNMQQIRSKDTQPEKRVRSLLHSMGFRFRLHRKDLPGNPDIVLPRYRVAIFVNGCFWHQHVDCKEAHLPATNTAYWKAKLEKTVTRDKVNKELLENDGWVVLTVWECELLNPTSLSNWLFAEIRGLNN